jgi:cyclophilin family peptidyl-prolyl cis-trans isomerase/cytochrome c5
MGAIKIGLHKDKAPITVANFMKYVQARHYDGTIFHRVMPGFMVQGGGLDAKMVEKVTMADPQRGAQRAAQHARQRRDGAHQRPQQRHRAVLHQRARTTTASTSDPGAGYAVFGEVLDGMDVVDKIVRCQTPSAGDTERARGADSDQDRARGRDRASRGGAEASAVGSGRAQGRSRARPEAMKRPAPPALALLGLAALPLLASSGGVGRAERRAPAREPRGQLGRGQKRGRMLYQRHCAMCHGDKGKGDGPAARLHAERSKRAAAGPHGRQGPGRDDGRRDLLEAG